MEPNHPVSLGTDHQCRYQVWYSSAWSRATLAAFREAVTDLLSENESGPADTAPGGPAKAAKLDAPVAELLQHWGTCCSGGREAVSLEACRRRWLEAVKKTSSAIGNFILEADRCGGSG